jgi:phenylpropionate dioxygenase-like ring-hydroxylating dioxygenase large terminal subunit
VLEGEIACPYHGWRYGPDGACSHIPSLVAGADIARGVGVRAFPCEEASGYVWVWIGEGAPSPAAPPPIDGFERFNWMQGSVDLKCSALAAIENNIDWCHPVFAHPMTHGQYFINQAMGFREQAIEMRRTARGLTVFAPPTEDPAAPMPEAPFVSLAFELPDRVTVAFAAGPQGAMRIVVHMIPTAQNACRQGWMVSAGLADGAPKLGWGDATPKVFEQDQALLESCQRAVDEEGHAFEKSVEADAPTLLARRIWALACEGKWPDGAAALAARRIVNVRS